MQAAEEKEFRLVLSEFTKKLAAGFIRATGSIFFSFLFFRTIRKPPFHNHDLPFLDLLSLE